MSTDVSALVKRLNVLEDQVDQLSKTNMNAYSAYGSPDTLALRVISQTPQLLDVYWSDDTGSGIVSWSAGTVIYQGEVYDLFPGTTHARFIYWQKASPNQFQGSDIYPPLGDDDFLIATNVNGVHDLSWNNVSAAKHITSLQVDSITADQIVGGSIDTTLLNLKIILVEGMTLTSNFPSAGSIAWSGPIKVYYNGSTYNITGASTFGKFVTWTVGATSFSAADSYAMNDSVLLIATNTNGIAAEAWNRGGTALSALQKENMAFSLLEGLQLQNAAIGTIGSTAGAFTTILSYTGAGAVMSVTVQINTAYTANTSAILEMLNIEITTDGSTTQRINILESRGVIAALIPWSFKALAAGPSNSSGNGTAAADTLVFFLDLPFTTSILVVGRINPTPAALTTGAANLGCQWAVKT